MCLGLRLLELLIEDYSNDHTLVQMNYDLPHSALMDAYVAVVNAPDPYPDAGAVEQILDKNTQLPFPNGVSAMCLYVTLFLYERTLICLSFEGCLLLPRPQCHSRWSCQLENKLFFTGLSRSRSTAQQR